MSLDEWVTPTVEPEIRAFVYSIVSAVGHQPLEPQLNEY